MSGKPATRAAQREIFSGGHHATSCRSARNAADGPDSVYCVSLVAQPTMFFANMSIVIDRYEAILGVDVRHVMSEQSAMSGAVSSMFLTRFAD